MLFGYQVFALDDNMTVEEAFLVMHEEVRLGPRNL